MKHYPIPISSDTGAIQDIPGSILQKAKNNPVLTGTVLGGVAGHLLGKHALIGAAIGWTLGFSGMLGKGQ